MLRWVIALVVAVSLLSPVHAQADSYLWPTSDSGPGPGGFATITVEPAHASRVKGPNILIRLRSDNRRASVVVQLDGRHIEDCKPFISRTSNPFDFPQWEFMLAQSEVIDIPVCGVAPGLHVLEIREGSLGSSLPDINNQRITFIVE